MSQVEEGRKGLLGRGNRVGQSQSYDAWHVQEPGATGHEQRRGGRPEVEAWLSALPGSHCVWRVAGHICILERLQLGGNQDPGQGGQLGGSLPRA